MAAVVVAIGVEKIRVSIVSRDSIVKGAAREHVQGMRIGITHEEGQPMGGTFRQSDLQGVVVGMIQVSDHVDILKVRKLAELWRGDLLVSRYRPVHGSILTFGPGNAAKIIGRRIAGA